MTKKSRGNQKHFRMEGRDYRGKERREKLLRKLIEKRRQLYNNPLLSNANFSLFIINYLFR
jgi:hypothetical protein